MKNDDDDEENDAGEDRDPWSHRNSIKSYLAARFCGENVTDALPIARKDIANGSYTRRTFEMFGTIISLRFHRIERRF